MYAVFFFFDNVFKYSCISWLNHREIGLIKTNRVRTVSQISMQINSELLEPCKAKNSRGQNNSSSCFFKMHMGLRYSYLTNEDEARIKLNTVFLKVCTNFGKVQNNTVMIYAWSKKLSSTRF
jgi:hypothetical protein